MSVTLVGLHHSPWTERARWALDHHGVVHRFEEYVPILGELPLRLRLRMLRGKLTVPVLFAGDTVLRESLDIVRWADEHGSGSPLAPADLAAEVRRWTEQANRAFEAGRSLYVRALLADPEALAEQAPSFLGPARSMSARIGTALFQRKHALVTRSVDDDEAVVSAAFDALRAALAGDYLLGRFTLADVEMAVALQHIAPVADRFIHLTPAARRCAEQRHIAARYPDLVSWRDRLYQRHRVSERASASRSSAAA
jgi:glutathione S-transferase